MNANQALQHYFGFRKFLDSQDEVIRAILDGRDTLVVMPTGGGKSLCYQLPALLLDGVTLVVSPLIALMKDQVDALTARGVAASCLNSTMSLAEQRACITAMRRGELKLVYVAPERFRSRAFRDAIREVPIGLFAVDEAHCLSMWGHDFRPDYFRLGEVLEDIGRPQVAAFTATATPEVRQDVQNVLNLRDPACFVAGFARPNLRFVITHAEGEARKHERLREVLREHRTGIVYCATRKRVEAVTDLVKEWGVKAIGYHGGLSDTLRAKAQDRFISGKCDVAVATNAFGMGIDRPDVRFVLHYEIPGSVEAYYQEAGRAGRDGESAHCELLFNYADRRVQEFFIDGSNPSRAMILDTYRTLLRLVNSGGEIMQSIRDLSAFIGEGTNEMAVSSSLTILDRHGYLERFDIPGRRLRGTRLLKPEVKPEQLEIDFQLLAEKEERDRSKLKKMLELAYGQDCRQKFILEYFGDADAAACGNCDACGSAEEKDLRPPTDEEFVVVRQALSGVARMSFRNSNGWEARYGRGRIVQSLIGSRSQDVVSAGLDRLTTYGILKPLGAAYVHRLFDSLLDQNLLQVEKGLYPLVTLTPLGAEVMQGRRDFLLSWPKAPRQRKSKTKRTRKTAAPSEPVAVDALPDSVLLEKIFQTRARLARECGDVAPAKICSDAFLLALTRHLPVSEQAARRLKGWNDKMSRFLPAFMHEIRKHRRVGKGA